MSKLSPNLVRLLSATCIVASAILFLIACEHSKHWRSSDPWPTSFLQKMSDPEEAQKELVRRMAAPAEKGQEVDAAKGKSVGCVSCHGETDEPDMHPGRVVAISCVDCHGGDATIQSPLVAPGRGADDDATYWAAVEKAHVQPRNREAWFADDLLEGRKFGEHAHAAHGNSHATHDATKHASDYAPTTQPATASVSATPDSSPQTPAPHPRSRKRVDTYALLNHESPEFIRFINPGDLRVAAFACGACHAEQVAAVSNGMMSHGAMLWGAALYNNGSILNKVSRYGESYSAFGLPQRLEGVADIEKAKWDSESRRLVVPLRWPTDDEMKKQGVLPLVEPLQPWNVAQPGNILRVFERGTKFPVPGGPTPNAPPAEIALPNPLA